jgi:hypothetical protein
MATPNAKTAAAMIELMTSIMPPLILRRIAVEISLQLILDSAM